MYGKIFVTMYDGTLIENWKGLVTFQQMIVLADENGVIDTTPKVLSARTGIPLEIIEEGIAVLEAEDKYSRSPEENGKRIERIDAHRPWGWIIVNYGKYVRLGNRNDKKQADKERIAAKREALRANKKEGLSNRREVSQSVASVAKVAHIDIDIDKKTKAKKGLSVNLEPPPNVEPDLWTEYLSTRKRLKCPNTNRALNTLRNKISKLVDQGYNANELIEDANSSGWKTVYGKREARNGNNQQPTTRDLLSETGWANSPDNQRPVRDSLNSLPNFSEGEVQS